MIEHVDTIVIGGGMAGLPFGLRAARHGPTVLVEGGLLGGTCLNRGCIPTKTMIHSAKVAHLARRSTDFGVTVGEVGVDLGAVVDRKDEIVASIRQGSYRAAERADDFRLVEGWARFVAPRRIEVDGEVFEAERVVINTGAQPAVPDVPGLDGIDYLDSTSALDLRSVPGHLMVWGGGYVGCELAQMFRRFGAEVTLLQRGPRLLPAEDPDVSAVIEAAFEREGIDVRTGTTADAVSAGDGGVVVRVGDEALETTHLLVATGRTPSTASLGLAAAGVGADERGFVKVGAGYETSAPGVFAIGDVIGPPMFTHSARDDAALLYRQLFRGAEISATTRLVPHAVFTDPEVATFGFTERAARDRFGDEVGVGLERFRGVAKARAMGETDGFVKIVTGPERQIAGATIVGPDAGNLIHELVVAATGGLTVDTVRDAIHIHPTLAEAVNAAAGGVHRPAAD